MLFQGALATLLCALTCLLVLVKFPQGHLRMTQWVVLTGSVSDGPDDLVVTARLGPSAGDAGSFRGILIGAITFWGSLVAFGMRGYGSPYGRSKIDQRRPQI